ncbi:MAG TPA: right-handed parallel beta-helix repeat-containing protein [Bacteroidota bacterium]|nr:right-handed parallel beta-helix repeat-containing protein [Bacteroidota bacterium]
MTGIEEAGNVEVIKRMSNKRLILLGVLFLALLLSGGSANGQIYVSTTGSDTSAGTIDAPLKTISKALSLVVAGDTVYVRGGHYQLTSTISTSKNGTSSAMICLFAYPGERPFLDFSAMTISGSNRGINLSKNYWHIRGFDVWKAGDNGMIISGSNNIVENCSFSENSDTGLQLGGGASNNRIINCDSYFNVDPSQGNADGFSPKLDVGTGNYFFGCRSWQNSDDGFDGYLRPSDSVTTTLEQCWTFHNGYLKSGATSSGNGNGFKMGGGDNSNADSLRHNMILKNCLSFDNRVKGYDQNNNRGSMTLLNCTAFRNGTNFNISAGLKTGSVLTVKNCISAGTGAVLLLPSAIVATNSWMPPFAESSADFLSVDTAGVTGPRQPDGSLPVVSFMHLAQGSEFIDAGTDVGLPYNGRAPDLGAFESDFTTAVPGTVRSAVPRSPALLQNFPNPFNPSTRIVYQLPSAGSVSLRVFNELGEEVETLVNGVQSVGMHEVQFPGTSRQYAAGVFFYQLRTEGITLTRAMMLVK